MTRREVIGDAELWPPLTPAELEADSLGSYHDCIKAIGEQHRAGRPLPECMLSQRRDIG